MKARPGTMRQTLPKTPKELASFIDHTLLKADATGTQIETLCREASEHGFYAVCVNGAHVAHAKKVLDSIEFGGEKSRVLIAAVVGFPLGAMTASAKSFEATEAVRDGAREIDMVMRIDFAKQKMWSELREDVAAIVDAVRGHAIVKVILETSLLSLDEISTSARICEEAGAHFIKTSTGFSTAGAAAGVATVEHIALMRESVGAHVQVKASGGVKTFESALALIAAGATRLGTSSGVALVKGTAAGSGY